MNPGLGVIGQSPVRILLDVVRVCPSAAGFVAIISNEKLTAPN